MQMSDFACAAPYLSSGSSGTSNLERNDGAQPGPPAVIDGLRTAGPAGGAAYFGVIYQTEESKMNRLLQLSLLSAAAMGLNAASSCDRACLVKITDQYLAAMVKHDPAGLPLAAGFKYTENTATIPMGDGLWVGASEGPTTFKIYAADPISGQVGFFGPMKE